MSENVLQNINAIYLEQEKALLSELRALNDELIVIASERKVKAAEIRVLEGSTSALKQELDILAVSLMHQRQVQIHPELHNLSMLRRRN